MKIFKENYFKYFPKFLLPRFVPKVIEDITYNEEIIGKIVGINLKRINYDSKREVGKYIQCIDGLKTQEESIYIEGQEELANKIKLEIEEKLGLNFKYGDNIRALNISGIIKDAFNIMEENYSGKEVLIICENKEKLFKILNDLSRDFKFVSVFGLTQEEQHDIYENIFDETGISIFQPNNIERLLKIYNVVVNFNDIIDFNIFELRNDVILIDFSRDKPFAGINKGFIIEDINFKLNFNNNILEKFANPELFETIWQDKYIAFSQVKVKGSLYYLEDIIETRVRLKGKF